MDRWKAVAGIGFAVLALVLAGSTRSGAAAHPEPPMQAGSALDPVYLDQLLAPVALYPDQLLAQMLLSSKNSSKVAEFAAWLKQNAQLKGSELQQAAENAGFEPSLVALASFPHVVEMMARDLKWTSQLGGAFTVDREGVFASIQRLRGQSQAAGHLKSTPQQTVETRTTQSGQQVIVIEPANPQVVYVPQYNPQVVYTQPTATTVVVKEDDDDEEAAIAGAVIGFAAGVAIGAAIDNNYYYGPYGWRGGAYMYNDAWDDWYDDREDAREDWYENREDAREDWQDHREDTAGERSERADDAREQRSERAGEAQQQRSDRAASAEQQRTERQQSRGTPEAQAQREQRRTEAQGAAQARSTGASAETSAASTQASGSRERSGARAERSGTRSDAFSNYSSGRSTRAASSRGERSRGGSRGGRKR